MGVETPHYPSPESEVREFLNKYPPGLKLRKILANPYLLKKKISQEGKPALIVELVHQKIIDISDLEAYLYSQGDFLACYSYCWRLIGNCNQNRTNSITNSFAHAAMNILRKIARTTKHQKINGFESILSEMIAQLLFTACEAGNTDLLIEFYNILPHNHKLSKIYTRRIILTLLPIVDTREMFEHTIIPMLQFVEYQNDKELLKECTGFFNRLQTKNTIKGTK